MIIPITPTTPNCYGVCCEKHAQCARYQAVDGAIGDPHTIGTCSETGASRPLFLVKVVAA